MNPAPKHAARLIATDALQSNAAHELPQGEGHDLETALRESQVAAVLDRLDSELIGLAAPARRR
jgi:hypothetical protein